MKCKYICYNLWLFNFLVISIYSVNLTFSQEILFLERSKSKDFLVRKINNEVSRKELTVSVHHWSLWESNLYTSNIYSISKVDFESGNTKEIYKSKNSSILEFTSNDRSGYFTEVKAELDRFESSKLFKIDLCSGKIKKVSISDSLNFSQLNISENGNFLTFIHTSNHENEQNIEFLLICYDIQSEEVKIIDRAKGGEMEFMGMIDDGKQSQWISNNKILYYKNDNYVENGSIYSYDLYNKMIVKEIDVPFARSKCFAYYNNRYYFIRKGEKIISTDKSGDERVEYEIAKSDRFIPRLIIVR